MAEKKKIDAPETLLSGTADDTDAADTIDMEHQSVMDTAEFKRLVKLDAELFGDTEDSHE